jgi:hypothetical protein
MKRTVVHAVEGAGAAVVAAGVFHLVVAPRLATWGTTSAEAHERLPGDDLVADPATMSTRAVSVDAPAANVWRWLVQIGTDRGGWYTYDLLERAAGVPVHNAHEIRDEWQHLAVGDRIQLAPEGWMGLRNGLILPVVELRDGQSIVLRQCPHDSPWDGVWSFHVRPDGPDICRLIARSRTAQAQGPARFAAVLASLVFDPVTFVMERGMLIGIKQRGERTAA